MLECACFLEMGRAAQIKSTAHNASRHHRPPFDLPPPQLQLPRPTWESGSRGAIVARLLLERRVYLVNDKLLKKELLRVIRVFQRIWPAWSSFVRVPYLPWNCCGDPRILGHTPRDKRERGSTICIRPTLLQHPALPWLIAHCDLSLPLPETACLQLSQNPAPSHACKSTPGCTARGPMNLRWN